MAKKKKPETKEVPATEVETKPVRLDLTIERHRWLRRIAASSDRPMAAYIRDIVNEHIDRVAEEMGFKK